MLILYRALFCGVFGVGYGSFIHAVLVSTLSTNVFMPMTDYLGRLGRSVCINGSFNNNRLLNHFHSFMQ